MSVEFTLEQLRLRWNDVLDHLEATDRIAWISYFDARLADLTGNELTLDFRDAQKFSGGHEYLPIREKLQHSLLSAIKEVLDLELKLVERL